MLFAAGCVTLMQKPEGAAAERKVVVCDAAGLKWTLYPQHIDWIRGGQSETGAQLAMIDMISR